MDNILENKWVLWGGVAIGALFLLPRLFNSASANTAAAGDNSYGYNPGYQISGAAASYLQAQSQYAYEFGAAQLNADVTKQAQLYATIQTLDAHATSLAVQNTISQAGVDQTALQTNAAIQIDQQQNQARTDQAWIAADVATHGQDTALATVRAQAASAQAIAAVTTMGALANAQIQAKSLFDVANINANKDITLGLQDVTKAQIASTTAIDTTQIGANEQVSLANINYRLQTALSADQKKIAAKKSDNSLLGSVIKGAAAVLPFLF